MSVEMKKLLINLAELVTEVEQDVVNEQRSDIKLTIRHVMTQIGIFEGKKKKAEAEAVELTDKLTKAQEKLKRLRDGDMDLVKKIKQEQQAAQNQPNQKPQE